MRGGFSEGVSTITKPGQKKELEALTDRLKNIQKEIDAYYKVAKEKIDKEHDKKRDILIEQYNDIEKKENKLHADKDAFEKYKKEELRKIADAKSINNEEEATNKENATMFQLAHDRFKADVALKTKQYKLTDEEYNKKVSELKKKEEMLNEIETANIQIGKTLEEKIAIVDKARADIKALESKLDYNLDKAAKMTIELEEKIKKYDNYDIDIKNRRDEADKMYQKANNTIIDAKVLIKSQKDQEELFAKEREVIKKEQEVLSKWRDELAEQDATQKEKNRAQLLKDRELDKKIEVIKNLRRA